MDTLFDTPYTNHPPLREYEPLIRYDSLGNSKPRRRLGAEKQNGEAPKVAVVENKAPAPQPKVQEPPPKKEETLAEKKKEEPAPKKQDQPFSKKPEPPPVEKRQPEVAAEKQVPTKESQPVPAKRNHEENANSQEPEVKKKRQAKIMDFFTKKS